MNLFKPHFWYNKSQRNGVFILTIAIVLFQVVIVFVDFSSEEKTDLASPRAAAFHKQIDSLKVLSIEDRKPKIYPFNPNYITDYKGEQLGMSLTEIEKLLEFRKTGKFVNSKKEFQNVTKISDTLLYKIAPYFKFPDWVVKRNNNSKLSLRGTKQSIYKKAIKKRSTTDINKATAEDLKTISGIGEKLSERIIKYRSKLQGFSIENQVHEVWGLEKEIADKVVAIFKVVQLPNIQKTNVNTVSFKELLKNPYIDYELCKMIFEYRDEVAELQDISELKKINGFPLNLYDRIVLYLVAE
ncbi:helix-hairpin-helix domain-containing protein [Polaribacter sp. IC073]|uniref:helix-hairpin-helix domain-containing protein n=1 Tax=Polaribacter sp. IC073 TaxID=2508540 RepID=UPI0011BDA898|nr:helix-hairpin-helix domain-containing protein [Polaribacter sp. IC073]TXD48702.1 helix-hairpin-helix domain-containing protein [Polaribacter sp. IC073]